MCQVCKTKQLLTVLTFEKPKPGAVHTHLHVVVLSLVFGPRAAQGGISGYKVHCSNKHSFMTQRPRLLQLIAINSLGCVVLDLSL